MQVIHAQAQSELQFNVTFALFKQKMKEVYQGANIGPTIDVQFKTTSHTAPNIRKVTGGWTLVPDDQLKQV